LESAAAGLESEIDELETALQSYVNADETQRQSRLLEEKQGALAAALGEWEALGMELEEAG
jgi:hypothetical protein